MKAPGIIDCCRCHCPWQTYKAVEPCITLRQAVLGKFHYVCPAVACNNIPFNLIIVHADGGNYHIRIICGVEEYIGGLPHGVKFDAVGLQVFSYLRQLPGTGWGNPVFTNTASFYPSLFHKDYVLLIGNA